MLEKREGVLPARGEQVPVVGDGDLGVVAEVREEEATRFFVSRRVVVEIARHVDDAATLLESAEKRRQPLRRDPDRRRENPRVERRETTRREQAGDSRDLRRLVVVEVDAMLRQATGIAKLGSSSIALFRSLPSVTRSGRTVLSKFGARVCPF